MVLHVIRCGETTWEGERRLAGSTDLPLSEHGREAVVANLDRLEGADIGSIYHSPDEAATATAQLVAAPLGARTRANAGLADPDLGLLEGLSEKEFADRFPKRFREWQEDPLSLAPREGEPIMEARARIFAAVGKVLRRSKRDHVGIVLHPLGLGLLQCWFADLPARSLWTMLKERPRIERYLVAEGVIDRLVRAGKAEISGS
jgi:broad specificity phosphatase PhoE